MGEEFKKQIDKKLNINPTDNKKESKPYNI